MLVQGLVLMVAGVTIVFLFLGLLVAVMTVSAKIIPRFNHILPDAEPKTRRGNDRPRQPQAKTVQDEAEIAVAIALAHQRAQR